MTPTRPTRLTSLLSKIHPPLPMNPRESRQLVKTISKSFQDCLDQEHPKTTSGLRGHSDAHISSILVNPHFDGGRISDRQSTMRTRTASTEIRTGTIEQLQTFLLGGMPTGAIQRFREEAVSGEATLESAKACLRICARDDTYKNRTESSIALSQIASGGYLPGRVIANWLWSTGLEESMEFIYDLEFTELLVPRLYLEGQSQRIKGWLRTISDMLLQSSVLETELLKSGAVILRSLVSATEKESGLNEAMQIFENLSHAYQLSDRTIRLCHEAAICLAKRLTFASNSDKVDSNLYDGFLRDLPIHMRGNHLRYRIAWLHLKHPLHPDPDHALSFLRQIGMVSKIVTRARTEAMIQNHLEVAEVLRGQRRFQDAEEVLKILETKMSSMGIEDIPETATGQEHPASRGLKAADKSLTSLATG